jgi:ABC-type sulfate/molybdate transport systems ATPase subunit
LIECQNLVCRFGAVTALDGVSFAVEAGAWVYILGPTASGKTTLLRAIAGLQGPDSGEIRLAGEIASNHRVCVAPHRRGIGFLFQEPSLWPHLDALANVSLGVREDGLTRRERRDRAREWLERLGAGHLARRFPSELSGGESRTVALARAAASRPRILLLDEPTVHLDLLRGEEMMGLLIRLHDELGLTTLCVTHHFAPPMRVEDRALILEDGRVRHDGPIGSLNTAAPTAFVRTLLRNVPGLGRKPK